LKLNTTLTIWLLSLILAFSSLTNAGHWHEAGGVDFDCIVCLYDAGSESTLSSTVNVTFPLYNHHQAVNADDVFLSHFTAVYAARAPPVFN
jgi:hypothetical protein